MHLLIEVPDLGFYNFFTLEGHRGVLKLLCVLLQREFYQQQAQEVTSTVSEQASRLSNYLCLICTCTSVSCLSTCNLWNQARPVQTPLA